jgi:hypothetical protein
LSEAEAVDDVEDGPLAKEAPLWPWASLTGPGAALPERGGGVPAAMSVPAEALIAGDGAATAPAATALAAFGPVASELAWTGGSEGPRAMSAGVTSVPAFALTEACGFAAPVPGGGLAAAVDAALRRDSTFC